MKEKSLTSPTSGCFGFCGFELKMPRLCDRKLATFHLQTTYLFFFTNFTNSTNDSKDKKKTKIYTEINIKSIIYISIYFNDRTNFIS